MNGRDQDKKAEPMVVRRTVAVLPQRQPDGAWDTAAALMSETLAARGFARTDEVRAALVKLRPLPRYLLTMHALSEGGVRFECDGMHLTVDFVYGQDEPNEDLSVPAVEALPALPDEASVALTFQSTLTLKDPFLEKLVNETSGAVLSVTLTALPADEKPPAEEDQPPVPPDEAEDPEGKEDHSNGS
jgi:hypothetical protein